MKKLSVAVLLFAVLAQVHADIYMHFPPGSNDRNRERNENRNNAARMCNTQNNAKGGYPWCGNRTLTADNLPNGYRFYTGSIVHIEWTAQHSCGPNANAYCTVLLQYACDSNDDQYTNYYTKWFRSMPNIRDGYPTGALTESDGTQNNAGQYYEATFQSTGQNDDGTNTIPCVNSNGLGCPDTSGNNFASTTTKSDYLNFYDNLVTLNGEYASEYGQHETFEYYTTFCSTRYRNKRLYTADQTLGGNTARFTRQNPNGGRSGFECQEERDYYPWWNPSPWQDMVIFVSNNTWCNYFQANSQNVMDRWYCNYTSATDSNPAPISADACQAVGGFWTKFPSWGIAAPDCQLHSISRDNHLGNVVPVDSNGNMIAAYPQMAYYDWKVPDALAGKKCVVRIRYNISSSDYPQVNVFDVNFKETSTNLFWDYRYNCPATSANSANEDDGTATGDSYTQCHNSLTLNNIPLYNRPYVYIDSSDTSNTPALGIAFNTNQVARTFQDRSYVLRFASRPSGVSSSANIYNLNTRGRRGNIVQCYPAVETDFVPNRLSVTTADYVHVQFCGSDFNPANNPNDGEGWQYSTRANMVQNRNEQSNFPLPAASMTMWNSDVATADAFAFVGIWNYSACKSYMGDNTNSANNQITNCGRLNPAPAVFDGGLKQFPAGTYYYFSTRSNNFSNRSMKGILWVIAAAASGLSSGAIAGIAVTLTIVAVGGLTGAFVVYAKKRPNSKAAEWWTSMTATNRTTAGTRIGSA